MRRSFIAAAALVLLFAVIPISSAEWRGYLADGNSEPNTKWDVASRMFPNANDAATDRIYFDVHVQKLAVVPIVPSPNVDGSGLRNYGVSYFTADLGYWRDCNDDGFVGDAVTGANRYPLELGVDEAICPAGTAYNDGTFAYEFLPIGPRADSDATSLQTEATTPLCDVDALCMRGSWNAIRDDASTIWHDWNTAADVPSATRLLLPFPQGTMSDTNGHFQYVDSLTFGSLSGTGGTGCKLQVDASTQLCWLWPSGQGSADPDGPGGERAAAPARQCDASDPVNNVVTGLGAAPGPNAACPDGSSPIPNVPDPVTSQVRDRWNDSTEPAGSGPSGTPFVQPWSYGPRGDRDAGNDECDLRANPADWELNPNGALYPTADHIYRATVSGAAGGGPCSNDPLDQAPGIPNVGTNFEIPSTPSDVAGKKAGDSGFVFFMDASFNPSETLGAGDVEGCLPTTQVNPVWQGSSQDLSARCGGMWTGGAQWLHAHGVTVLNPAPLGTFVASFYADVNFADVFGGGDNPRFNVVDADGNALVSNNAATALPGAGNNRHTYGEENCAVGRGTTQTGRWVCDPLVWINEAGFDPGNPDDAEAIFLTPKPGKGYDLRDVECYDNAVADTSINAAAGQSFSCPDMVEPLFN